MQFESTHYTVQQHATIATRVPLLSAHWYGYTVNPVQCELTVGGTEELGHWDTFTHSRWCDSWSIRGCEWADVNSTKDVREAADAFSWNGELFEVLLMTELQAFAPEGVNIDPKYVLGEGKGGINRFTTEWSYHTLTEHSRKRGGMGGGRLLTKTIKQHDAERLERRRNYSVQQDTTSP